MPSDENYVLKRVLEAKNPEELRAAAKALLHVRDGANKELALCLRHGDQVYKQYLLDGKTKRFSTATAKVVIEEDDMDKLPTRADLKRLISRGAGAVSGGSEDEAALFEQYLPPAVTLVTPVVDILKQHMWSEKSRRLYELVDQSAMSKELRRGGDIDFRAIQKIAISASIGLKDTFMSSPVLPGTLDRSCSEWLFGSLKFVVKAEMLHSSEVESQILVPLTNMYNNFQHAVKLIELAKPSHLQKPCSLPQNFMEKGVTSNLPIMGGAVLKAVLQDGSLHLRPLCTTGDLLLALNQLMDPEMFLSGVVQLPDPHKDLVEVGRGPRAQGVNVGGIFSNSQTTFRPPADERAYYRLDYVYRKHTRWFKYIFKAREGNAAIKDYTCPFMCPEDFAVEEVPPEEITAQMTKAVYVLRRACLPPQEHLSLAAKKKAGMKFVSELKLDFEILSPIDPEQYAHQVVETLKMKRLEEDCTSKLSEDIDTNGHEFELRIINCLKIVVMDIPNNNRVTVNSVTHAVMMMKSAARFKKKRRMLRQGREGEGVVNEGIIEEGDEDEEEKDKESSSGCSSSEESEAEIESSREGGSLTPVSPSPSTRVRKQGVKPTICMTSTASTSTSSTNSSEEESEEEEDDDYHDSDDDYFRRRSSEFLVSIPRKKHGVGNKKKKGIEKKQDFAAFQRRNSELHVEGEVEVSLAARQEALQRKVLAVWGMKKDPAETLRKKIERFRQNAMQNKLQMRKVSAFNTPDKNGHGSNIAKNCVVTSIVGNRRVSMMNNVVIHTEEVQAEKPKAPASLKITLEQRNTSMAQKNALEQVKQRNPQIKLIKEAKAKDEQKVEAKELTPFQKRKITLNKLMERVDEDISSGESLMKQAAQSMPPTLLTVKDTHTHTLSTVNTSGPRRASSLIQQQQQQQLKKPNPPIFKKTSSRKKSVGAPARKKSISVAPSRKQSIGGTGRKKSNATKVESQPSVLRSGGDADSEEEENVEGVEYSVHSVPSVLSDQFQKHTHRKKVKLAKINADRRQSNEQKKQHQSGDVSLQSSSNLLQTGCESIAEVDLDMGSPSKPLLKPTKGEAKGSAEQQRRESVAGLMEVYQLKDKDNKAFLKVQLPSSRVRENTPETDFKHIQSGFGLEEEQEQDQELLSLTPQTRGKLTGGDIASDVSAERLGKESGQHQLQKDNNAVINVKHPVSCTLMSGINLEEDEDEIGSQQQQQQQQQQERNYESKNSSISDDISEDLAHTVQSTCRKSVSSDPQTPTDHSVKSPEGKKEHLQQEEQEEQDKKIEFSLAIVVKKDIDNTNSFRENPFKQHVPSLEPGERESEVEGGEEREEAIRNKELEQIIRLLEGGVKDTRQEHRRRIMQARHEEEARQQRARQKFAQECEQCLQNIIGRMDPLLGEKVVMGLRQRQNKRRAATEARKPSDSCSSSSDDDSDGSDESAELISSNNNNNTKERNDKPVELFVEMSKQLLEEEELIENNLIRLHQEEIEDDRHAVTLEHPHSTGSDDGVVATATVSLHELAERSQVRSEYLAKESERLSKLRDQVEQRRKEAADRKLSIIVKLTKRLKKNEALHNNKSRFPARTGLLEVVGNVAHTPAQKKRAENHARIQQRLVHKINKHVGFLRTHVINMGDTAKLPFPGVDVKQRRGEEQKWQEEKQGLEMVEGEREEEEEGEEEEEDEQNDIDGFRDISAELVKNDGAFIQKEGQEKLKGTLEGFELQLNMNVNKLKRNRVSDLTEKRIDEVVGSYNLSDLKKFRLELLKYMNFMNDIENDRAQAEKEDKEDGDSSVGGTRSIFDGGGSRVSEVSEKRSVQLEMSSVNMQVNLKHLVDSIEYVENGSYGGDGDSEMGIDVREEEEDFGGYLYEDDKSMEGEGEDEGVKGPHATTLLSEEEEEINNISNSISNSITSSISNCNPPPPVHYTTATPVYIIRGQDTRPASLLLQGTAISSSAAIAPLPQRPNAQRPVHTAYISTHTQPTPNTQALGSGLDGMSEAISLGSVEDSLLPQGHAPTSRHPRKQIPALSKGYSSTPTQTKSRQVVPKGSRVATPMQMKTATFGDRHKLDNDPKFPRDCIMSDLAENENSMSSLNSLERVCNGLASESKSVNVSGMAAISIGNTSAGVACLTEVTDIDQHTTHAQHQIQTHPAAVNTKNAVVVQMNIPTPPSASAKGGASGPLSSVQNRFPGRNKKIQWKENATTTGVKKEKEKDDLVLISTVHTAADDVAFEDKIVQIKHETLQERSLENLSLEETDGETDLQENSASCGLEISVGKDTTRTVALKPPARSRKVNIASPPPTQPHTPFLKVTAPDLDCINQNMMDKMNSIMLSTHGNAENVEDTSGECTLNYPPLSDDVGLFNMEDTQNANLSFFSLYQEDSVPAPPSPRKPLIVLPRPLTGRQPLRINTADITKISSEAASTSRTASGSASAGGVPRGAPREAPRNTSIHKSLNNAFKGNPKPPRALKPSELKTTPLKNKRTFKRI